MTCLICGHQYNGSIPGSGVCERCAYTYNYNVSGEMWQIPDIRPTTNVITVDDLLKQADDNNVVITETITLPRVEKLENGSYELFKLNEHGRIVHKILSGTEDEVIKQLKESI